MPSSSRVIIPTETGLLLFVWSQDALPILLPRLHFMASLVAWKPVSVSRSQPLQRTRAFPRLLIRRKQSRAVRAEPILMWVKKDPLWLKAPHVVRGSEETSARAGKSAVSKRRFRNGFQTIFRTNLFSQTFPDAVNRKRFIFC